MKVGSNLYGVKKPKKSRWADGTKSFESFKPLLQSTIALLRQLLENFPYSPYLYR